MGGLSAFGGPPGALLGALFSTVSLILGFFAPSPPSLVDQIEEMLRDLHAETQESQIKSAADAVFQYKDDCDKCMKRLPGGGVQDPALLTGVMDDFNLLEGNTITPVRDVRGWLLKDGNWDLDGWPEILNMLRQAYMHLMLAVARQNLYANDEKLIKEYVGDPPDFDKQHKWELLQVEVKLKLGNIESNNRQQRDFLRQILPVARMRGTFVLAHDHWLVGTDVFAATGPKALRNGAWGTPIFSRCRRVSVVPPLEGADHPNGRYDIWVLDADADRRAYHNQLLIRSRKLAKSWDIVGGLGTGNIWVDWWPEPPGSNMMFTIYATRNLKEGGALGRWNWTPVDPKKYHLDHWMPFTPQRMLWLRVASPSAFALPGDPDGPAVYSQTMYYVTLKDSKDVYVVQHGTGVAGTLTVPMASYRALAVDAYCVWISGDQGLVGATHASIQATLSGRRPAPNWLGPPRNNKSSIIDVSACGDGTLTVISGRELFSGL